MKKIVVVVCLMAISMVSSAASISGTTNFRVIVPEILVLYHWDDAVLNLTPSAGDFVYNDGTPATNKLDKVSGSPGNAKIIGTSVDDTTLPTGFATGTKVEVILENSWAVRSISNGVKLTLTNPNATLTRVGGTETATISGAVLQYTGALGTVTGSGSSELQMPSQWSPSIKGDIKFELDLTGATRPGEYNSHGTAFGTANAPGDTATDNAKDTFLLTLEGQ